MAPNFYRGTESLDYPETDNYCTPNSVKVTLFPGKRGINAGHVHLQRQCGIHSYRHPGPAEYVSHV